MTLWGPASTLPHWRLTPSPCPDHHRGPGFSGWEGRNCSASGCPDPVPRCSCVTPGACCDLRDLLSHWPWEETNGSPGLAGESGWPCRQTYNEPSGRQTWPVEGAAELPRVTGSRVLLPQPVQLALLSPAVSPLPCFSPFPRLGGCSPRPGPSRKQTHSR